jgi:hypothetical protein
MTELEALQQIATQLNLYGGVLIGVLLGLIFWLVLKE